MNALRARVRTWLPDDRPSMRGAGAYYEPIFGVEVLLAGRSVCLFFDGVPSRKTVRCIPEDTSLDTLIDVAERIPDAGVRNQFYSLLALYAVKETAANMPEDEMQKRFSGAYAPT